MPTGCGPVAVVAAFVVFVRWAQRQKPAPEEKPLGRAETTLRVESAAALLLGLTLPLWIVLWFVWMGGSVWR